METVTGLIIVFIIVKIAYNHTFADRPARSRIFRYTFTYFAVFVPHSNLISWPFRLTHQFNIIVCQDIGALMMFATLEIFGMYLCVFIIDRMYDSRLGEKLAA